MTKAYQKLQSYTQLSSFFVAGAICLPMILIGEELYQKYGWMGAISSIMLGNLFLLLVSLITASMGVNGRKSTAEYAKDYFGEKGATVVALLMIVTLLTWFAIQLNLITESVLALVGKKGLLPWQIGCNTILGLGIAFLIKSGISALTRLAAFSLPILLVVIGVSLFAAPLPHDLKFAGFKMHFSGISFVISAALFAVIDMPTYLRFAKTPKDAYLTSGILFGLALPIVQSIGVYLALGGKVEGLFSGNMMTLFVILAGLSACAGNVFSSEAALELIVSKRSTKERIIIAGVLGTLIALCNPFSHMEVVLNVLGVVIGAIGSVMIVGYLVKGRKDEALERK